MAYNKVKQLKETGNLRTRVVDECKVCSYQWNKDRYYKQLTLDLENKIHKDGEWVVAKNEERFEARINETLKWAYFDLGAIIAEDVFYRAIDDYWYSIYLFVCGNFGNFTFVWKRRGD